MPRLPVFRTGCRPRSATYLQKETPPALSLGPRQGGLPLWAGKNADGVSVVSSYLPGSRDVPNLLFQDQHRKSPDECDPASELVPAPATL